MAKSRALVLDDDSDIRRVVKLYLETMHDISVDDADGGISAIKKLLQPGSAYGLIVTDLFMIDMNGLEFVSFVKRHPSFRDIPIIMLTSNGEEKDRDKALRLGVNDYLLKPFYPTKMKSLVEKYQPKRR